MERKALLNAGYVVVVLATGAILLKPFFMKELVWTAVLLNINTPSGMAYTAGQTPPPRIEREFVVPIAAHDISKGTEIDDGAVEVRIARSTYCPDYWYQKKQDVVGRVAEENIMAGSPFRASYHDCSVRSGY